MAWVTVQAGVWMGRCFCAAVQLQTQSPGDTATTTQRNATTQVECWGFKKKKWPSSSLRGPFLGHGADANVGQKEPLLSIKKEQRTGWSNSRGRRGCLLRWKIAPAALHSPSPRTEGIKSSTDERSGVKLQWGNLIRLLLVRLIWANRRE